MTREEIKDFCDMKAQMESENEDIYKAIIKILEQEPQIRPKGHWIDHSDDGYIECPKCGSATNCDDNIADLHFCFSCGAELEEVVEE